MRRSVNIVRTATGVTITRQVDTTYNTEQLPREIAMLEADIYNIQQQITNFQAELTEKQELAVKLREAYVSSQTPQP